MQNFRVSKEEAAWVLYSVGQTQPLESFFDMESAINAAEDRLRPTGGTLRVYRENNTFYGEWSFSATAPSSGPGATDA
jgi:hypothetical protein